MEDELNDLLTQARDNIRDYDSDTDDFNIAYDLGYMSAIEVVSKLLENYKIVEKE